MQTITVSGVLVTPTVGGKSLSIGNCGYLGRFNMDHVIRLTFQVTETPGIKKILVSSNAERGDVKYLLRLGNSSVMFHDMPVKAGQPFDMVDLQKNCVHLVEMSDKGEVMVTNIAVITQKGEFYLISQPTYKVQVYRAPHGIAVPSLWVDGGFQQLVSFIDAHYKSKRDSLPDVTSWKQDVFSYDEKALTTDKHMVVKFWSLRRGCGVAVRKDGCLIKIYWGNVKVPERVPVFLATGEIITAQSFIMPRGQSSLPFEALGIKRPEYEEAMLASA